jgi:hypothetical protein
LARQWFLTKFLILKSSLRHAASRLRRRPNR